MSNNEPIKLRQFKSLSALLTKIEDNELCFWDAEEFPGVMYKCPDGRLFGLRLPAFATDLFEKKDDMKRVDDLLNEIGGDEDDGTHS